MDQIHEVIWLEPWCDGCNYGSDGRTWCKDNVYDPCEECGREPVKYVLAVPAGQSDAPAEKERGG